MSTVIERIKGLGKGAIGGLVAVVAIIGVATFFLVARQINTSPAQCATCHAELTKMWESSLVHPPEFASCFECHAGHPEVEGGPADILANIRDNLIPEKYLSSAERINGHCLGCHPTITSAKTEEKKFIRINHKAHMEKPIRVDGRATTLGCVDCHYAIVHDKSLEQTNRPPMFSCFVADCHSKERNRDRCQVCHYQNLQDLRKDIQ